ncbi:LGFP repeat-containing protein [Bacillus sp. NA_146.1]
MQYAGKDGYYQDFSRGRIYYHPYVGAYWVYGEILVKYLKKGGPRGFLGFPTGDERDANSYVHGRYNDFQGGSIYWSPGTGAHTIHGSARTKWLQTGGPAGYLGFPTYDQVRDFVRFEKGVINRLSGDLPIADSRTIRTGMIHTKGGAAVNGFAELTLNSDGTYSYSGKIHDSGAVSYDVIMVITLDLREWGGPVLAFTERGDVEGSLSIGGDENHTWGKFRPHDGDDWKVDERIREHWDKIRHSGWQYAFKVNFGAGDLFGLVAGILVGSPLYAAGKEAVQFIKGFPIAPNQRPCCPYSIPVYEEPFDQWSLQDGCVWMPDGEQCPPGML